MKIYWIAKPPMSINERITMVAGMTQVSLIGLSAEYIQLWKLFF